MQRAFVLVSFLITLLSTSIIVSPIHAAAHKPEEFGSCQECLKKQFDKGWFEHSGGFKRERSRSDPSTDTVPLTDDSPVKKKEVWVAESRPSPNSKLLAGDKNVKLPHKCSHLYKGEANIVCRDLFFWMINAETGTLYGTLNAFLGKDNNLVLRYFLEHYMSEEFLAGALDLVISYFYEKAKPCFGADKA